MASRGSRVQVPQITDLSKEELASWRSLAEHPILDGQLIEDITLSTTTKYTRVPHALGRPYRGFIDCRGVGLTEVQSNSEKDKAIYLQREAAPVLIDSVTVNTATSSVVFSGLSGNTDEVYLLKSYVTNGGGSADFLLQPNEVTTNQDGQRLLAVNATVSATGLSSWTLFSGTPDFYSEATVYAKTGDNRMFHSQAGSTTGTPSAAQHFYAGGWTDTTTEVTSLAITNASTAIGPGSKFCLYSLNNRATKSAIWIF